MHCRIPAALILGMAMAPALVGCSPSDPVSPAPPAPAADTTTSAAAPASPAAPLLQPFDPPTLEELDAKAKWQNVPVVDAYQVLSDQLASEKPKATIEEALRLKNTSDENNAKILSAFGRLPENDSQVNFDASITRHINADARSLNPLMIDSAVEMDLLDMTGFGLFAIDREMTQFASADAVVSWQRSEDGLMDKFVLRDDLTWSDGKPITAHDVEFSFQTILDEKIPIPAVRSGTEDIRWVEAYDDHTLVFFHKAALATNPVNMSFPILPKHFYEPLLARDPTLVANETYRAIDDNPISGGPYIISKRVRGQEVTLTRRDSYYMHNGKQVRRKPYFKDVRFRIVKDPNTALLALKNGDIDEMRVLQPEQWQTQTTNDEFYAKNTKIRDDEWSYSYVGWNLKDPKFEDVRVRRAMAYAYNYDELLKTVLYGLYRQSVGVFHPNAWMAPNPSPTPYVMDLDKAEDLLDEAGWVDSNSNSIRDKVINGKVTEFTFTLLCGDSNPLSIKVAQLLKSNLERIGVICNVKPTEFTVLQDNMQKHQFEAYLMGWGTGSDPDTLSNIFKSGEGRNHGQYSNKEVDRLFEDGRREFDKDKRAKIYGQIATLIFEDQPYLFLYVRSSLFGMNNRLRGVNFSPRDPFGYSPGFGSLWTPAAAQ